MKSTQLPIFDIFKAAVVVPLNHWPGLLMVGAPFLVCCSIAAIVGVMYPQFAEYTKNGLVAGILFSTFAVVVTIAIIGCHRIVLLGEEQALRGGLFQWTGNEFRYAGWWVVFALAYMLLSIPLTLILLPILSQTGNASGAEGLPEVGFLIPVLLIPVYYVVARLSLLLPSVAVGIKGRTMSWAWELSHGNGLRLAALLFFIPFCIELVVASFPPSDTIVASVFYFSFWIVFGVIQIAMLSYSYEFLMRLEDESASSGDGNLEI